MLNKKIPLLVMMFVMISFLSKAQYEKGSKFWQVEGTFSGSVNSNTNSTPFPNTTNGSTTNSALTFKRAVFGENNIAKGWLLGYKLEANTSSTSYSLDKSNNYIHTIQAGYFVDKFKPLSKSLAIYGELLAKAGYGIYSGTSNSSINQYSLDANLNVGFRYYLKKNLFINGQTSLVNLSFYQQRTGNYKYTNVNLNSIMNVSSLSISIGKSF